MEVSVFKMIDKFLQEKKIRRRWLAIFLCLALIVALLTTAALKLNGVAKTRKLTMLKCPAEFHEHVDSCYDGQNDLVCGYADFVVHTHSLDCYVDDVLTCKLPVIEAHKHTEDCYAQGEYLICGKKEVVLHTHTVECFKEVVFDEKGMLVALASQIPENAVVPDTWTRDMIPACGQMEVQEHIHGAGCLDTVELTPEEAAAYISSLGSGETQEQPDGDDILKKLNEIADSITATVQKKSGSAWVLAGDLDYFRPDDEIRIDLTYAVEAGKLQKGDVIVYQFPEVLALDKELTFPVTQNGVTICTAAVATDGKLTIIPGNHLDPAVGLEGSVTLTCRIREDAKTDGSRFQLPGTETAVSMGKKQPDTSTASDGHDLIVVKENEGFVPTEDGSGKKTVTYTVTVRSKNGTGGEITLNDYFRTQPKDGKPLPEFGDITVTKNPGKETVENHGLRAENGAVSGTLPELGESESYTITYTVTVDPENYDTQGGYLYLSTHVDAYFADDGHARDNSGALVQDALISKTGKYENGRFVWTIWTAKDSKGKILREVPDEGLRALIDSLSGVTVSVDCSDGQEHGVTLDQLLDGYAIDCGGEHTFTFETKPALKPGESVAYGNSAHLSGVAPEGDGYDVGTGSVFGVCDNWSGTLEGTGSTAIGGDDDNTVQEQLSWAVTIHFPDDETWTDFTYTDSLRQTMNGWFLQESGESARMENHPVHHYQTLSRLEKELDDTLRFWLAQAGLENDLAYTCVFKDKDGNEVTDGSAEVVSFEIRFHREAGRNLYGQSICFDYTSLVDTGDFVDDAEYTVENDFTLPDFTGTGSVSFQYNERVFSGPEMGKISVKKVWLDVKGDLMTSGMPGSLEMILKQYAFKGGIYLTEKPADPENWCEMTLQIDLGAAEDHPNVTIRSLNDQILGTNVATVWVPLHSWVKFKSDNDDPDSIWGYTFNVRDASSCVLKVPVHAGSSNVYMNVTGDAPVGFTPSGDYTQYGSVTLNGVDDDWSYTWDRLPMDDGEDTQYVYTVEEAAVPDGYYATVEADNAGVFTITNRKSMERGKITVEKQWVDAEGYPLIFHPDSVELELQKRIAGSGYTTTDEEWATVENSGITLPNENGEWTASWTDLEDGEYRVVEKMMEGYAVSYTYTSYDDEGNKYTNPLFLSGNAGFVTVTNIKRLVEDGEIVVVKIWEYEDGTPDTSHPDTITVIIKRALKSSEDGNEPPSEPGPSEPKPSEPTEPKPSEPVPTGPDAPQTGIETNLLPYLIAELVSGILILEFALYNLKRRNRRKEKAIEEDIDE